MFNDFFMFLSIFHLKYLSYEIESRFYAYSRYFSSFVFLLLLFMASNFNIKRVFHFRIDTAVDHVICSHALKPLLCPKAR